MPVSQLIAIVLGAILGLWLFELWDGWRSRRNLERYKRKLREYERSPEAARRRREHQEWVNLTGPSLRVMTPEERE